jgi:hypothetical protein
MHTAWKLNRWNRDLLAIREAVDDVLERRFIFENYSSSAQGRPGAPIFSGNLIHRVQLAAVHLSVIETFQPRRWRG